MPPARFKLTIPTSERPQNHPSDLAANEIGFRMIGTQNKKMYISEMILDSNKYIKAAHGRMHCMIRP